MATAEELLNSMLKNEASVLSATDAVFVIDGESRTINVPDSERLFGVEGDKDVERKYFQCPKIVGDNQDLSQDYILFINYVNANGDPDAYKISDMQVEGDNITFSWLLEENVTKYRGDIQFAFGAIIPGDAPEDPDKNRWNTTINTDCTCLVGLKCTQQVAESNPDALAQIWAAIDELKAGGGGTVDPEQIKQAVNGYLEENPPSGMTAEEKAQLQKNTEDISQLSEEIGKQTGTGLSTEAIDKLEEVGNYLAYTTADGGSKWTELISILRNSSSGGSPGGTEVTLSSISAIYTGGDVPVGTSVTSLTGITVTATYSDGSMSNVTGYALSGEIVEGENTIMVSYEGKTTTFTVVGYVEEAETTEPVYRLAEATTFDGTNTVDTDYALCENYKAFTVVVDFTSTTKSGSVFGCDKNASYGVGVKCLSEYFWSVYWSFNVNKDVNNASNGVKYVITHEVNSNIAKAYYIYKDALTTQEFTIVEDNYNSNMNFTNTVILGNDFTGIINDFKIYERVLTEDEINEYLGV